METAVNFQMDVCYDTCTEYLCLRICALHEIDPVIFSLRFPPHPLVSIAEHSFDDDEEEGLHEMNQSSNAACLQPGSSGLRADADAWRPQSFPLRTDAPEWHPCPLLPAETATKINCRFFSQGFCRKGAACPFSHEVAAATHQQERAAVRPKEVEFDLTIVLDGVCCKFGPGFEVKEVVTDFDSRVNSITISGLEHRVKDSDILGKLLPFGAVGVARKHETYAFAKFDRPEDASAAVTELNGSLLDQWAAPSLGGGAKTNATASKCNVKRCVSVSLASPPGAIVTHNTSVKVQWYAPSRCAWAHYDKRGSAEHAAMKSNGKKVAGHKVSAKFQPPQPRQRSSFSVWIGGLGQGVSRLDVISCMTQYGGCAPCSVTMGDLPFADKNGSALVERVLQKIGPLSSFQEAPHGLGPMADMKRKALAKFARPCDALEACTRLDQSKVEELGGGKLFLQRVFSAKFMLPNTVYTVVDGQVKELLALLEGGDQHIRHKTFPAESVTCISIQADSPNALAFAKGMLNPLLVGDCLKNKEGQALWHAEFSKRNTLVQLERLNNEMLGAAFIQRDLRRREIRVWGDAAARERAMTEVLILHAAILNQPCAVPVKPEAFRAIFQEGQGLFGEMESSCGARSVSLDWKTRSLLFAGDDAVVGRVRNFIATRLEFSDNAVKGEKSSSVCPICYCEPDDDALRLSCQHHYCTACFHEWIAAASAPCGGSFPLSCLSEDCKQAVASHDLKQQLSRDEEQALMRAALDEYVNSNLDKLQYCISAGCSGLYSVSEARTARCSACLTLVCTACKVEEHQGLTCGEHSAATTPADALRNRVVEEILTLHCPRCAQAFFDFEGCFALKCSKCPCNFCGWCLADCGTDSHAHVTLIFVRLHVCSLSSRI